MGDDVGSARAVIVMGVSGSGKTTVAELIAAKLGAQMLEGDRLHPPHNVAKMRAGIPLDDADRWPWLDAIGKLLSEAGAQGRAVVMTCSALKRIYRERLLAARPGSRVRLSQRLAGAVRGAPGAAACTNTCRPRCSTASSRRWRSRVPTNRSSLSTPRCRRRRRRTRRWRGWRRGDERGSHQHRRSRPRKRARLLHRRVRAQARASARGSSGGD